MGSPAKKLAIRFLAWVSGLVLASALFSLVGISLLVDFVRRLAHWGAPTEEEAQRQQAEDASRWWASLLARAGGNPSAASDLCGPAPAEELARLVKEAPAIVLDGAGRDPRPLVVLKPYVRRFGPGALAYTTVTNDEFRHFFVPGVGSLAYLLFTRYGRRVVMACNDPLAPRALWLPLTARFFAFEPSAYVSHASREYATVLASMGKIVNHFGIEPIIKANEYDFSGPQMRIARQEIRRARDAGLSVRELSARDLQSPATRRRLHEVSGDWMATKRVADRQLRVYCRHFDPDDLGAQLDGEVRLFVAERRAGGGLAASASEGGGPAAAARPPAAAADADAAAGLAAEPEIEGFLLLDPMYREDGRVFGYVNSSNRMRPGAHPGTLKLLLDTVLDTIRAADGMDFLHLGLTPFHHSRRSSTHFPGGARWMDLGTEFFFRLGNNLYAFKRLAAAKSRFGGGVADDGESYNDPSVIMSHVYLAHGVRYPFLFLMDMYATFEYIGFVGDDIYSSIVKGLAKPEKKREAKPVVLQLGKKELRRLASAGGSSAAVPGVSGGGGGASAGGLRPAGGSLTAGGGELMRAKGGGKGGGSSGGAGAPRPPRGPKGGGAAPPPLAPRLEAMASAPATLAAAAAAAADGGGAPPLLARRPSRPAPPGVAALPPTPASPVAGAGAGAEEEGTPLPPPPPVADKASAAAANGGSGVSITASVA